LADLEGRSEHSQLLRKCYSLSGNLKILDVHMI